MTCPKHKLFESEEYLVQICDDHVFYAEKDYVRFDFKNIANLKVFRNKAGNVHKITYRMKGQLSAFQIDGFDEAAMEEIASLLKERAREFSIGFVERGGGPFAGGKKG
jgi:hypothetical protein